MRSLTNFYEFRFRFKWTATAAIGIHPTKTWLSQLVNFNNAIWHFIRTICNKISVLNFEKMPQKCMECFRLHLEHIAWIEHQFLSGIKDSRKAGSLWGVGGVRKLHQSWLAKGLRLGLLCWGFKGVQEEITKEEASTLQIGSVTFSSRIIHQSTTPSLSQTIRPPYSPDLAPCDFWLFLSSEAVVMRQLRRWKRLWRRSLAHSHKRTSIWPSRRCWNGTTNALQPGEIT